MSTIDRLLAVANAQLGTPYLYGAEDPGHFFDCSGLTQFVFGSAGITLPRTAAQQQAYTTRVTNPLPGDLVFYGSPAHHVGLYIGAGKMIDAPDTGLKVRVEGVGTPTNYGRVPGAGAFGAVTTGVLTAATDSVGDLLGGARQIVLETSVVVLGLALIGFGLYRATAGARDHKPSTGVVL